ncbi:MAG: hypothetical protein M3Y86_13370 [Verrucomicrobiota bacterium]|nr:hypothetical protein [Verrucomicrobiota bacterium]
MPVSISRNPIRRGTALTWSLLGAALLLFLAQLFWRPAALAVVMEIRTEQAARLLLPYYSGGTQTGYVVRMVESAGKYTTLRFPIDEKQIDRFRLLQVGGAGALWLRHLRIERFGGKTIPISADHLHADAGILAMVEDDNALKIQPQPGAAATENTVTLSKPIVRKSLPVVADWLLVAGLALSCVGAVWWHRFEISAPLLPGQTAVWIISLLSASYVLASTIGLNGSSSTAWRFYADYHDPDASLLFGTTEHIREDEWLVQTDWILSQLEQRPAFPLTNPSIGEGPVALITSLPVRHWSILLRPQFLGFFILPLAQAFAFYWNFKWFALLLGAFLFLNLITRGRSLLALGGASFIFFSAFIQWWFSSPTLMPEMVGAFFFALWSGAIIFRARSPWMVAGAAVVLLFAIEQFVLCCYPRFQIPFAYFALVLAAVGGWPMRKNLPRARVAILLGTLVTAAVLIALWYGDIAPLLRRISGFAYPGQLVSTGGVFHWAWQNAALLEFNLAEQHFPEVLSNSCEAAGFIFLLPILVAVAVREVWQKRVDPLLIGCVLFLLGAFFFMTFGIPLWLARVSGWWAVSSGRVALVLGVGSAIALCRYFAHEQPPSSPSSRRSQLLLFTGFVAILCALLFQTNRAIDHFVTASTVLATSVFFALVYLLIWQRRALPAFLLLVLPLAYTNGLTNPIGCGLPGFTHSPLFETIRRAHEADPSARWLVLGPSPRSRLLAHFAKASGADVFGGTRCTPDEQMNRALDPEGKFREIASRYAQIWIVPSNEPAPRYELTSIASYTVHLPLQGDYIRRLGARYILAVDMPPAAGVLSDFTEVAAQSGCRILHRESAAP